MFDHPDNLRHPTTWHARDYGLIAANPFGLHDFLGEPRGKGDHVITNSEPLVLKYRIVITGSENWDSARLATEFEDFTK